MKVAIYTLGCKVNQYETQAMEQTLRAKGHQVVEFSDEADAYVVNTCSVTAVSDQKSRQVIHRVQKLHPAAVVCVDSLCSAEGQRLGRTVQFSDTGLYPAQADHTRHLTRDTLGVPVVAAGIPTLMQAQEGADLVVTPRALDSVIAHGAALLAGSVNRALQPRLTVEQGSALFAGCGAVCSAVHLCPQRRAGAGGLSGGAGARRADFAASGTAGCGEPRCGGVCGKRAGGRVRALSGAGS